MNASRNILLIGLALLLSPIAACAQMVCDIDCSLRSAQAAEAKIRKNVEQVAGEGRSESEKHPRGTHCDEEAVVASAGSMSGAGSAWILKGACRGDGCVADLGLNVSGVSLATSKSVADFARPAVEIAAWPGGQRASKLFSSPDGFPIGLRVLAVAGVLRI